MAAKLKTWGTVVDELDLAVLMPDPFRFELQLAQLLAELNSMPDFFPVRTPSSASVSGTPYSYLIPSCRHSP